MEFLNLDLTFSQPSKLLFVDSKVNNYQDLISAVDAETNIILLNSVDDGIEQISETLTKYKNITSLHLVSHGEAGAIDLGSSTLNLDNLDAYTNELQNWTESLTNEADIIVYSCNVAANYNGQALIDQLSTITDADVAASTDLTGNYALGGDWKWEYITGKIESNLAFEGEAIAGYNDVLNMQDQSMMGHHSSLNLVPHS